MQAHLSEKGCWMHKIQLNNLEYIKLFNFKSFSRDTDSWDKYLSVTQHSVSMPYMLGIIITAQYYTSLGFS